MNSLVNLESKTSKFKKIEDILKDPAAKAKLNNLIDEAVRCKLKINLEQDTIKDLRAVAREELGLNPKHFNYYVGMVFNNDYAIRKDDVEQLEALIDAVMKLLPADNSNYQNDSDE